MTWPASRYFPCWEGQQQDLRPLLALARWRRNCSAAAAEAAATAVRSIAVVRESARKAPLRDDNSSAPSSRLSVMVGVLVGVAVHVGMLGLEVGSFEEVGVGNGMGDGEDSVVGLGYGRGVGAYGAKVGRGLEVGVVLDVGEEDGLEVGVALGRGDSLEEGWVVGRRDGTSVVGAWVGLGVGSREGSGVSTVGAAEGLTEGTM